MAIFHTVANLHVFFNMDTYFMGALTFCAEPPFAIHSISSHPILLPSLYDGAWVPKFHNYVVFPTGLVVEEDEKHLLLSLGHQDMSAWVYRMDIEGLLDSLEPVSSCQPQPHHHRRRH